ncbi:MAG: hydroxymethylbilane synthase [Planctomycetota bacterium]
MSTPLVLGTRGSDLALAQSRSIAERLRREAGIATRLEIIKTTGDREQALPADAPAWSMGAFVKELETALLEERIDLAVHSYKDMATAPTPGLAVAAVPERADPHDVLVCSSSATQNAIERVVHGDEDADSLFVVGTSSPRRAAQLRSSLGCSVATLRGNVPTRLNKLESAAATGQMHAICIAAAGLERLKITPEHAISLPIDRFPTAAAQGALAVQTRRDEPRVSELAALEHEPTRRATDAERSFLRAIEAGCHTPAAAYATCDGNEVTLRAEMFDAALNRSSAECTGRDPVAVGQQAAARVLACR